MLPDAFRMYIVMIRLLLLLTGKPQPLLSRAKNVSASAAAMAAEARQTDFCTYLSGILLGGLLLNALFGLC